MTIAFAITVTQGFAVFVNTITIALLWAAKLSDMYKRSVAPILEFIKLPPPDGKYIIDTQFGKINYVSGDVAPVISTRINANDAYYVIEIDETE